MSTRELILGDWNPVVRDPIDVLRAAFVAGALTFLALGKPGWLNLAVAAAAVVAVRFLSLPRVYDLAFVAAMGLVGWGEALRLYDRFAYFDVIVHFLVPLLGAPVVYIALARLEVLPDPADETTHRHHAGIFVVTLALGIALGAIWEVVEWSSDATLGSALTLGEKDTIGDLVADTAGAFLGALLLVAWTVFGWGSVRRIPGENRMEETSA